MGIKGWHSFSAALSRPNAGVQTHIMIGGKAVGALSLMTETPFAHACVWRYHSDSNTWSESGRMLAREFDELRRARLPYFNGYSMITEIHEAGECAAHEPEPLVPVSFEDVLALQAEPGPDGLAPPAR